MKKKLISRVAAAVGMCAAVAVVIPAVSVLNMFRSVSIAAEPSDVSSSSEAASESADAWDQLLTDASNSEFASVIELVAEEKAAWEEARKTMKPMEAWASIVENPEVRKSYTAARGLGGLVRTTWDEALEIIASANLYTIKKYGPDRISGFSPIPGYSMVQVPGT